jgi:hypothetical protein
VRTFAKVYPLMLTVQRRYPTQRSIPIIDAQIEFDLRTAIGSSKSLVKKQPQWLKAVFEALTSKQSNLQVAIGAAFPYGDKRMHSRDVLNVIAGVWVGCKPWLDIILGRN